jgi:hypothetical protein
MSVITENKPSIKTYFQGRPNDDLNHMRDIMAADI